MKCGTSRSAFASAACAPVNVSAFGSHVREERRRRSQMFAMWQAEMERWPISQSVAMARRS